MDVFGLRPKHLPGAERGPEPSICRDRDVRERPPVRRVFRYLLGLVIGRLFTKKVLSNPFHSNEPVEGRNAEQSTDRPNRDLSNFNPGYFRSAGDSPAGKADAAIPGF